MNQSMTWAEMMDNDSDDGKDPIQPPRAMISMKTRQDDQPAPKVKPSVPAALVKKSLPAVKKPAMSMAVKGGLVPIRSTKPLTIPKEFHFSNTNRKPVPPSKPLSATIKPPPPLAVASKAPATSTAKTSSKPLGVTQPKPFRFQALSTKPSQASAVAKSPYVPLAERLKKFESSLKHTTPPKPGKVATLSRAKVTVPKSPYLRTNQRKKKDV
jgi:hypothetical protein